MKVPRGVSHPFGGVLSPLRRHRAIYGVSQGYYRNTARYGVIKGVHTKKVWGEESYQRTHLGRAQSVEICGNFCYVKVGGFCRRFSLSLVAHIHFSLFTGEWFTDFLFIHVSTARRLVLSIHRFAWQSRANASLTHSTLPKQYPEPPPIGKFYVGNLYFCALQRLSKLKLPEIIRGRLYVGNLLPEPPAN